MNAVEIAQARADAAQRNRAAMPLVTAIVDEVRSVFGSDCRIVHALEGEVVIGRPHHEGVSFEPVFWPADDEPRVKKVRVVAKAVQQGALIG